jgi:hypothetical protein
LPHWVALAVSCVVAATIAHAQQRPAERSSPGQTARIVHGRVVADDTGNPLRNARVALMSDDERGPVLTDADGRFAIEVPAQAPQTVSAAKTGYATTEAELADDADIRLPRSGIITGRVLEGIGEH